MIHLKIQEQEDRYNVDYSDSFNMSKKEQKILEELLEELLKLLK